MMYLIAGIIAAAWAIAQATQSSSNKESNIDKTNTDTDDIKTSNIQEENGIIKIK